MAVEAGLAGCSIEDATGRAEDPIYDFAARRRARRLGGGRGGRPARAHRARGELPPRPARTSTTRSLRLRAFAGAGADVLYAPGLTDIEDIRAVVDAVEKPVNVLALPTAPPVAELAAAGVARVSVGGAFAFAALGAAVEAADELRSQGTYGFWAPARRGRQGRARGVRRLAKTGAPA